MIPSKIRLHRSGRPTKSVADAETSEEPRSAETQSTVRRSVFGFVETMKMEEEVHTAGGSISADSRVASSAARILAVRPSPANQGPAKEQSASGAAVPVVGAHVRPSTAGQSSDRAGLEQIAATDRSEEEDEENEADEEEDGSDDAGATFPAVDFRPEFVQSSERTLAADRERILLQQERVQGEMRRLQRDRVEISRKLARQLAAEEEFTKLQHRYGRDFVDDDMPDDNDDFDSAVEHENWQQREAFRFYRDLALRKEHRVDTG